MLMRLIGVKDAGPCRDPSLTSNDSMASGPVTNGNAKKSYIRSLPPHAMNTSLFSVKILGTAAPRVTQRLSCPSHIRTFRGYIILPPRRTLAHSAHLKMKEAIVSKGPKVNIHEVPIPRPNADQVLIKVVYSGSNPKDWKRKK